MHKFKIYNVHQLLLQHFTKIFQEVIKWVAKQDVWHYEERHFVKKYFAENEFYKHDILLTCILVTSLFFKKYGNNKMNIVMFICGKFNHDEWPCHISHIALTLNYQFIKYEFSILNISKVIKKKLRLHTEIHRPKIICIPVFILGGKKNTGAFT